MYRQTGPSKGNRRPTIAAPGSSGSTRPVRQKGGGGNKAAGSVEPTASNSPTVSVSPSGTVTPEHFGPSPAERREAHQATVAARESRRRVRKVKSYVRQRDKELTPKREVRVSKDFLDKAASPKPVTVAEHSRKLPGSEAPRAKPVTVSTHQRKLPGVATGYTKAEKEVLEQGKPLSKSERLADKAALEPGQQAKGREPKGTPQERQEARKQVVRAKRQLARSKPELLGDFGPAQKQFIEQTAKETGLSPKTIAVQSIAEEGHGAGSPAANYEASGENNFLNIGPGRHYSTPQEGAAATAANYKGGLYDNVLATKGQPASTQLAAIEESPWDGNHYAGSMLQKILASGEVQVKPGDPQAVKNYKVAVKKAKSLGLKVGPPPADIRAEPATKTIKVKATAKGAVEWAESLLGEQETGAKIQKLGENFGLNTVTEPWCANFVANNLARRGFTTKTLPTNPNNTPQYEEWGEAGKYASVVGTSEADLTNAKPGDVLTFSGEHTAMYVGNDEMISGNFSDEVERTPVSAHANLSMIIRPKYKGGWIKVKETTALPGTTSATGSLSESSAPAIVSAVSTPPTNEGQTQKQGRTKVELTPFQELTRRVKKLQQLGVDVALPGGERPSEKHGETPAADPLHKQLAALEKRYSIGAV